MPYSFLARRNLYLNIQILLGRRILLPERSTALTTYTLADKKHRMNAWHRLQQRLLTSISGQTLRRLYLLDDVHEYRRRLTSTCLIKWLFSFIRLLWTSLITIGECCVAIRSVELSVCLSVCLSCFDSNFREPAPTNFTFGTQAHSEYL